jgi:hypothetical protein
MSKKKRKNHNGSGSGLAEVFGGLIALFMIPGVGIILLIVAGVLILVMLGVFIWVYLTLQAMHLITAIVFSVVALFMFYIGTHSGAINEESLKRFPWLPLLIPAAFLFGYLADLTQTLKLTVAPLAMAAPEQGAVNVVMLFLLVAGVLYVINEHFNKKSGV